MSNASIADKYSAWGTVTPELLKAEYARIGTEFSQAQPYVEVATSDGIRHWAEGTGDRNRLWVDRAYAEDSVWGRLIAPPTLVMAMNRNVVAEAPRGFGGLHSWHLGSTFEWERPIYEGDSFRGETILESIDEVQSRYAGGTAYDQIVTTRLYSKDTDERVCTASIHLRRFERRSGQTTSKYGKREKHVYTEEEIEEIAAAYQREVSEIRGRTTRYIEDVSEGDELPSIIRGPLTTADCVAFSMAWGGSFINAHGFAWEFMLSKPSAFPRNESNIPDSPERTHFDDAFAQAIGAPAAFDYGPQRIAWAGTLITNWISDAGRMSKLQVRILRPNYHGDLVTLTGRVRRVNVLEGTGDIEVHQVNQLGDLVADASAEFELPKKVGK